ncbi:nuclear transport factor 2 family protein [Glycomyces paridis]|uniref:Nuclear transport factor 2 family protein n=1 Tax=Glycomyces paridis TaxID=2126555 RepID=A0A4S8NVM6_9ACTN|nr:nuclear transport factor 2 family protein [Glycomyces paridis]THV20841.1 nuclear transport factor 2 family protein [Glycomyces paridis]
METANHLEDRLAIAALFARLAHLLDDQAFEGAAAVFTEDVTARSPRAELHGRDALVDFMRRSRVEGEFTQHMHTDPLVDLEPEGAQGDQPADRAKASVNSLVRYYREGEPPHRTSGLRLQYFAVRTPQGWRFAEGRTTLLWTRED